MFNFKNFLFFSISIFFILESCTDKWKEHSSTSTTSTSNVLQNLRADNSVTLFVQYLKVTGFDTVLTRANKFTVLAPSNRAIYSNAEMAAYADSVAVKDTARLLVLLKNHIAYNLYSYNSINAGGKFKMVSGKNIIVEAGSGTFQGANFLTSDKVCSNGIIHVVDKVLTPLPNIWETLKANDLSTVLTSYIQKLEKTPFFDKKQSTIIGTNPTTGASIYDSIKYNKFLYDVAPLNKEDSVYTFFVVDENIYNTEYSRYYKYCKGSTPRATDSLTNMFVFKDFVVKGKYLKSALPDTLMTPDSVKIHVPKSAIVKSIETSNGIIHVISQIDIPIKSKVRPIIIEGEDFYYSVPNSSISQSDYPVSYYPVIYYSSQASNGKYAYWKMDPNPGCNLFFKGADNFDRLKILNCTYTIEIGIVNLDLVWDLLKNITDESQRNLLESFYFFYNFGSYPYVTYKSKRWVPYNYSSMNYRSTTIDWATFNTSSAKSITLASTQLFNPYSSSDYTESYWNIQNLSFILTAYSRLGSTPTGLIIDYIKLKPVLL